MWNTTSWSVETCCSTRSWTGATQQPSPAMQSWWWWWWWWWWWRLRNTAYTHVIYEVSFIGQTAYVRLSYLIGRTVGGAAVSTVLAESVFACFQFVTFSACGLGTAVVLSSRCCRDRLVFRWIESDYSACSISHLWVDVWVWGQSRCLMDNSDVLFWLIKYRYFNSQLVVHRIHEGNLWRLL